MSATPLKLHLISQHLNFPSPKGRGLALNILKSSHTPLSARDIWNVVRNKHADLKTDIPPLPVNHEGFIGHFAPRSSPFPNHPIRSISYLKAVILKNLQQKKLIEKVHYTREPTPQELEWSKLKKKLSSRPQHLKEVKDISINNKGLVDVWGWKPINLKSREEILLENQRIQNAGEGQLKLDRKKWAKMERVSFLEEWGHLNRRRQRAQKEKMKSDKEFAMMLEEARALGRQDAMAKAGESPT